MITIIGGTGDLGYGLAIRLVKAGYQVVIGSRQREKAENSAQKIKGIVKGAKISGYTNQEAVQIGEVNILSVPSGARKNIIQTLKSYLKNKIILDVTVPLLPGKSFRYQQPVAGSNAEETEKLLGKEAKVVAGFHNVSALLLADLSKDIACDVLIVGNYQAAKNKIIEIVHQIGLRAFDAGTLDHARTIEGLTPIIINLNKKYKKKHIGIKLTGI